MNPPKVVPAANVALLADRLLTLVGALPGRRARLMAQVPEPMADLIHRFLRSG